MANKMGLQKKITPPCDVISAGFHANLQTFQNITKGKQQG
jgi:hypothetical protein